MVFPYYIDTVSIYQVSKMLNLWVTNPISHELAGFIQYMVETAPCDADGTLYLVRDFRIVAP